MTRGMTRPEAQTFARARKVGVVAMVERNGNVRAYVQPREGALDAVSRHVSPEASVYTDEWVGYSKLRSTHPMHLTISHGDRVYARGDVHTQTIEGFFGNVKNGIAGNYHGVSAKWLQSYFNEYVWRYNHRGRSGPSMFTSSSAGWSRSPSDRFGAGGATFARSRMNSSRVGTGISIGAPFLGLVFCVGRLSLAMADRCRQRLHCLRRPGHRLRLAVLALRRLPFGVVADEDNRE